ncbi:MAG: ATP-dependent DNA ligase [Thermoleophilia bacterium]|nr:ATP-dependent DNA ligase [Thermoleophilia bacterium]
MNDPSWPFAPPVFPMEARVRDELPAPPGWAYEPKWDGFRTVAWSGPEPRLDSRNQRPLLRYFPELVPALASLPGGTVVDGEVVVVRAGRLDFQALQNRLHPAESRVRLLAAETPAALLAFDLLADRGDDLRALPYDTRRARLERLFTSLSPSWHLTPSTRDAEIAALWFREFESAGCDGIVAKRVGGLYVEGKREMVKVKHRRSVDAVVAGYRLHKDGDRVGSLLLGLYDGRGKLHFVGHCSSFSDVQAVAVLDLLRGLAGSDAFGPEARRPGAESRWTGDKDLSWEPLRPELVVQVSYDQLTGGRFRHATRFERWRPDKDPEDCTFDQLERPAGPGFADVVGGARVA